MAQQEMVTSARSTSMLCRLSGPAQPCFLRRGNERSAKHNVSFVTGKDPFRPRILSMLLSMNASQLVPWVRTNRVTTHSPTSHSSPCRVISDTHNPLAVGSSPTRPTQNCVLTWGFFIQWFNQIPVDLDVCSLCALLLPTG
jgi:hypothetical protein